MNEPVGAPRPTQGGAGEPPAVSPSPARPGLGRRLAANTVFAAGGRLTQLAVWMVFTPAILHALGPEGYAVWALFFALTGYLGTFDFGLSQGTLRQVAAARQRGDEREGGDSATLAVLGFVVLGLLWLAAGLLVRNFLVAWLRIPESLVPAARLAIPISAAIFVVSGISSVIGAVLQGYGRFDLAARPVFALSIALAAGFLWVLARQLGLPGLMWTMLAGWSASAVLAGLLLRGAAPGFRWSRPVAALSHLRTAFAFGGPMQVSNLLAAIHTQVDKILLSRLGRLSAVAPYELGNRIAIAGGTFPQLLLLALLPEVAALHAAGDTDRLHALYVRGSRWLLSATAILFSGMLGGADRLYAMWIGGSQPDAALALRLIGATTAIAVATGIGTTLARGIGRTDLETWSLVIATGIHVPLAWWWIPRLGLPGALLAYTVSTLVAVGWFFIRLGGLLHWKVRDTISPVPIPGLAMVIGAVASFALDRALPAATGMTGWMLLALIGGAGCGVTAVVLLMTRYVSWTELHAVTLARWERRPG